MDQPDRFDPSGIGGEEVKFTASTLEARAYWAVIIKDHADFKAPIEALKSAL